MWIFYCVVGISNILESVKSIRNPSCSSRIPNIKTINNIADYNFYISMARLKANFPAPGHLAVNFSRPPGIRQKIFSRPRAFVHKNFVDSQDARGWDGQGRNCWDLLPKITSEIAHFYGNKPRTCTPSITKINNTNNPFYVLRSKSQPSSFQHDANKMNDRFPK